MRLLGRLILAASAMLVVAAIYSLAACAPDAMIDGNPAHWYHCEQGECEQIIEWEGR